MTCSGLASHWDPQHLQHVCWWLYVSNDTPCKTTPVIRESYAGVRSSGTSSCGRGRGGAIGGGGAIKVAGAGSGGSLGRSIPIIAMGLVHPTKCLVSACK